MELRRLQEQVREKDEKVKKRKSSGSKDSDAAPLLSASSPPTHPPPLRIERKKPGRKPGFKLPSKGVVREKNGSDGKYGLNDWKTSNDLTIGDLQSAVRKNSCIF